MGNTDAADRMARRYDGAAARYGRWWAPVLAPTARDLLDDVARRLGREVPERILDLGAGTGTLSLAAIRRWPSAEVIALDASGGMLAEAEREASRTLSPPERERLRFVVASADATTLEPGSVDLVVSSFVLQLVPNRARALAEIRRVLRPGGTLGFVTWLEGRDGEWLPDEAFDRALDEAGIDGDEPVDEGVADDIPSVDAAAAQVRRAGFRDVIAVERELEYRWTATSYLDFLEQYDEADLFRSLEPAERKRLRDAARRRLAALAPADFEWRVPVVSVLGTRSPDRSWRSIRVPRRANH